MSGVWAIVDLIDRLDGGAVVTSRQTADRYRVSKRTAERWLVGIEEHRALERLPSHGNGTMWRKAWPKR